MESEKVKEIKKALACCSNGECGVCSRLSKKPYHLDDCRFALLLNVATLINELESENEWLSNTEIGELIKENEELEKQCVEWSELDFNKRNKITELKDRIAELEKENAIKTDTITDLLNKQEFYETEKLKQFAERLKAKMPCEEVFKGIWDKIDETLKECTNEQKM